MPSLQIRPSQIGSLEENEIGASASLTNDMQALEGESKNEEVKSEFKYEIATCYLSRWLEALLSGALLALIRSTIRKVSASRTARKPFARVMITRLPVLSYVATTPSWLPLLEARAPLSESAIQKARQKQVPDK